ncbi:M20/M25/M40 family metallo-hydrolase [Bacillus tequilensis]|uniref:M20/M25/M40 family metallo-hydrolase n=1 Tax=Bacillus tequilensis TaxID=227866 RepID=UPI000463DCD4|nr:M20/M25/M40 family metallo-hydrolase [Bacillus tequilensis]MDR4436199.1 M20/M25/M40 family metallo-hydrolase [Bacillus tequilensis]SPT93306.1 peptidase M42 family protein [Bacillus tequilensis]SPU01164.1 peptidase M42 family protein [Bacillus tequilensis]
MKKMKKQLVKLLNIQAPSGEEHKVVKYVKPILQSLCDKVWLDDYKNLLAEKKVGSGKGATIILSAHMDSVSNIIKDRVVYESNGTFYSTKGILGADDRAGIAILLAVLRNVEKTAFEGTIKVAFSREEEIGCVGSQKIDPEWIKGSDLAIVVDRRGNNDIVVGNYSQAFCSNEVGKFFEDCSALQDMNWQATEGGISDACTFAELNVNAVNLSAGYQNEHTEKEYVVYKDMQKTVKLILQVLASVNDFAGGFGDVPLSNNWVEGYDGMAYYNDWNDYADDYEDLWEGRDQYGTVSSSIVDGNVCITQRVGEALDEVYISTATFEKIIRAYERNKVANSYTSYLTDNTLPSAGGLSEAEKVVIEKHGKIGTF